MKAVSVHDTLDCYSYPLSKVIIKPKNSFARYSPDTKMWTNSKKVNYPQGYKKKMFAEGITRRHFYIIWDGLTKCVQLCCQSLLYYQYLIKIGHTDLVEA